ncbi:hypothetical protein GP486_000315 [Trichoglossum hirsutum]|uniref:tRNA (guanine(26)-N(2))-dimethyltransferase n=1 Tax=Trichoglossum hirsutum TaxID=265104 RepID=A0A9P8LJ95_9PEZI|nr:hypothetical protein GP486_000315 [Trichoglossum hirsutum]
METEVSIDENLGRECPLVLRGIEEPPVAGQSVWHDGKRFTTVREGLAHILVPADITKTVSNPAKPLEEPQRQSVFYNPIQQFNRDLSVLAIRAFGEELIKAKRERREKKMQSLARKGNNRGKKRKIGEVDDRDDSSPTNQADGLENGTRYPEIERDIGGTNNVTAMEKSEAVKVEGEGDSAITGVQPNQSQGNCVKNDWTPRFSILDALSATGLRALRYCQEIPFTTSVTANDLSREATTSIDLNIRHNRLDGRIASSTGNAVSHMYQVAHGNLSSWSNEGPSLGKYDVIDLDPYGTAAPFLDAAVQALADGGLLCVTCTDSGVFASGGYPEKTYALYGGLPIKGPYSHEGGLRLILHAIATSAARYGLAIEPLLSLSIDFYVRLFVRIRRSPAEVKFLAGKTMIVYCCDQGCGAWRTQLLARTREMTDKKGDKYYKHSLAQGPSVSEHCECCGFKTHLAGPMYAGPIQSRDFIRRILSSLPEVSRDTYATVDRIEGMLSTAIEETSYIPQGETDLNAGKVGSTITHFEPGEIDTQPFFFIPNALCKVIHCQGPSADALRGAFRYLGYKVTASHCKAGSFKTNAPWPVIWHIFREWVSQKSPVKEGALKEYTPGWNILKGSPQVGGVHGYSTAELESTAAEVNGFEVSEEQPNSELVGDKQKGRAMLKVVFDEGLGREKDTRKIVRYQQNPRANWGPLNMAKGPRK